MVNGYTRRGSSGSSESTSKFEFVGFEVDGGNLPTPCQGVLWGFARPFSSAEARKAAFQLDTWSPKSDR